MRRGTTHPHRPRSHTSSLRLRHTRCPLRRVGATMKSDGFVSFATVPHPPGGSSRAMPGSGGSCCSRHWYGSRGSASDLDTSADDDGTTRQVAAAYVAASLGAPLLRRLPVRPLPALSRAHGTRRPPVRTDASGLVHADAVGGVLAHFEGHGAADHGRPGPVQARAASRLSRLTPHLDRLRADLGEPDGLAWVGGLLVPTYARRMAAEEQLLERQLVGYGEYRARTKKLVPGLW